METTSITIEWSELNCTLRNGYITGYKVRYGPTSTTPSQRQIANISDPSRRMFTVDREFITAIEVAAVNINGTGPYSTPLTVHPSGNILSLCIPTLIVEFCFSRRRRWRRWQYCSSCCICYSVISCCGYYHYNFNIHMVSFYQ